MILVKGDRVQFLTTDGNMIVLPSSAGIIHDPEGEERPRCEVFFGPYKLQRKRPVPRITRAAVKYYGRHYQPTVALIDLPHGPWRPIAHVTKIFYKRGLRGAQHAGGFHHPFARAPLTLEKSGKFYRLSLPGGCIVDDRGFVFP